MCSEKRVPTAVFVSGGGTNLQALLDAQKSGAIRHAEITLVISSSPSAYALERAKKAGVEAVTVSRKQCGSQEAFERKIQEELEAHGIGLIVLAGFLCILSADFTKRWPERILNVRCQTPLR